MHSLCTFKIYNRNYIKAREKKELNNKKTRFTLLIKAVKQKKSIREKHKKNKQKQKYSTL